MDFLTAAILAQDGITSGAIYALLGLALVLVFSVTRIIFLPQGEFVVFGALTIATLEAGRMPLTAWLLVILGALTFLSELTSGRRGALRRPRYKIHLALQFIAYPVMILLLTRFAGTQAWPLLAQAALTLAMVIPMGPMLYRLVYKPMENASVLVLLIASVALHFVLVGVALVMFGAEGFRTAAFIETPLSLDDMTISGQSLLVLAVAMALIVGLYLYFERSLSGKALRATAINALGARLVGISTSQAGSLAVTLTVAIGTLCGILIVPLTTIYYDSGFLIGLKGFVAAIFGGLTSYPIAAAGALLVGLLESFSSFWASAFKEVIVFTLIIPVLLWRSLLSPHGGDDE
ncbi:branched-chain amino acid ABC transporter permease [Actimicrobium antarcticum]|uniref:Branched-chain amino acid ABC transporter permease n=1 Tax=Actimicrobium antarcticum TaxID=1051899 RepID=A0ABP7TIJ0_9BURK